MNDYLKKNRNGNDKRYHDGNRKVYNNPMNNPQYNNNSNSQYHSPFFKNNDNRQTRDKRKGPRKSNEMEQMTSLLTETIPAMKKLLEEIASGQKKLGEIGERRAVAEEKNATAMENIAIYIKMMVENNIALLPDQNNQNVEVEPETELEAEAEVYTEYEDEEEYEGEDEVYTEPEPEPAPPRSKRKARVSSPTRAKVIKIISNMRAKGSTYGQIADHLEGKNISTFSGKGRWHAQTIHRLCQTENLEA